MNTLKRRSVLRGMIGAGAVGVALPFLDCFLNENGTALAASGAPLPVRFGTWNWGCGVTPERWIPRKLGADYELGAELLPVKPLQAKVSVLTGFNVMLDGRPNLPHISGIWGLRTGTAPADPDKLQEPTFDLLIADVLGTNTRFRSLELAATGNAKHSYSRRNAGATNPAEVSPLSLYTRVFGAEFQDPNAAEFTADPNVLLRKSVLSAVKDHRDRVMRELGSADRARLDQYFTSIRQLEQQLELQLQKPPPAESCVVPSGPKEAPLGTEIEQVMSTHMLMTELLAMALACNQTRVFNMVFSDSASSLRRGGDSMTHHTLTHDEPVDRKLGLQPKSTYFVERSMEAWGQFIQILDRTPEGAGTLLDRCLVMAHTDTQYARLHSIDGVPIMLAGSAAGRVRTGLHVAGNGDPITRIGLTLQQVMGVATDKWGTGSMQTSKPISEILG